MAEARVRIVLDDELNGGNTWVTVVPVRRLYANQPRSEAVALAATEALGRFNDNIRRDRETVTERLIELERSGG